MIKQLLSLILVILVIIFFWKIFFNKTNEKKVKFAENVEEIEHFNNNVSNAPPKKEIPVSNSLEKLNKIYDQVNPSNFYTQNYNTPNFTSNIRYLNKYYSIDLPPNNNQFLLPKEPFSGELNNSKYPDSRDIIDQVKSDPDWLVPLKQPKTGLEEQSDYWNYKNEIPMNGGSFGGIVGFENMGDSFSLFYSRDSNDIVEEQESMLKRSDDLRSGMGVPQKEEYNYNMSNP